MHVLGVRQSRRRERTKPYRDEETHWKHDGINDAAMTGRMMAKANSNAIPDETVEITRRGPLLVRPLRHDSTPAASVTTSPAMATMTAGIGANVSQ